MLYGEYVKEKYGRDIVYSENGFATYKVNDVVCHIDCMFVRPSARNSGEGKQMLRRILEEVVPKGVTLVMCEVDTMGNGADLAMQKFFNAGFSLLDCAGSHVRMYLRVGDKT